VATCEIRGAPELHAENPKRWTALLHHLDDLLRHRPRSISPKNAAFMQSSSAPVRVGSRGETGDREDARRPVHAQSRNGADSGGLAYAPSLHAALLGAVARRSASLVGNRRCARLAGSLMGRRLGMPARGRWVLRGVGRLTILQLATAKPAGLREPIGTERNEVCAGDQGVCGCRRRRMLVGVELPPAPEARAVAPPLCQIGIPSSPSIARSSFIRTNGIDPH
jgi:hypothetical protein